MNLNLHSREEFIDAAETEAVLLIGDHMVAKATVAAVLNVLNWDYDQEARAQRATLSYLHAVKKIHEVAVDFPEIRPLTAVTLEDYMTIEDIEAYLEYRKAKARENV